MNIMRIAGVLTLIGIAALLLLLKARNPHPKVAAEAKAGGAAL